MSFDGHNLSIKSGTCDVIWWTDCVPSNLVPVPEICDVIWWTGYLPSNLVPVPDNHDVISIFGIYDVTFQIYIQALWMHPVSGSNPEPGPQIPVMWHSIRLPSKASRWMNPGLIQALDKSRWSRMDQNQGGGWMDPGRSRLDRSS